MSPHMPPHAIASTAPPDDAALVARVRAGDAHALGGLYDRYASDMLRVAWRLTGSVADGEDVVHDVFVRLADLLRSYEHRHALGAWLRHVTARTALMRLRSQRRRREDDLEIATLSRSTGHGEDTERRADLEQAIARLPDTLRTVFVLRQIEGFTHDEIAALLDITAGASRVRLSRALEVLRTSLTEPVSDVAPRATTSLRT